MSQNARHLQLAYRVLGTHPQMRDWRLGCPGTARPNLWVQPAQRVNVWQLPGWGFDRSNVRNVSNSVEKVGVHGVDGGGWGRRTTAAIFSSWRGEPNGTLGSSTSVVALMRVSTQPSCAPKVKFGLGLNFTSASKPVPFPPGALTRRMMSNRCHRGYRRGSLTMAVWEAYPPAFAFGAAPMAARAVVTHE